LIFLRIVLIVIAFYIGYDKAFSYIYDTVSQLHLLITSVIVAIAGISGFEGLFFEKKAALAKGFESGGNYLNNLHLRYYTMHLEDC